MSQDVLTKNMHVFTNIYASKLPFSSPQSNGFILTILFIILHYTTVSDSIIFILLSWMCLSVCMYGHEHLKAREVNICAT